MRLIRRVLLFVIAMTCITCNAMADCAYEKITLQNGKQLTKTVNIKQCKLVKATVSDQKATEFKLGCVNSKFQCFAHKCSQNLSPDKNGICVRGGSNTDEQARFHKGLLTHTYQKRNFYDACDSFSPKDVKNKTVLETKTVIKELGKKIKYACVTDMAEYNLSTALAIGLITRYNWSNGIGQIMADNCTTQQNHRFKNGGGRSVRCVSNNGVFVEFVFGKMDSLSTSREDVAGALCPVFGFDHMNANGNRHRCHIPKKDKTTKELAVFLRTTEMMDVKYIDNGYFEIIPLRTDIGKKDELSKYLDNSYFKDVLTSNNSQIKMMLKKYIQERLKEAGYTIESIKFYSARSKSFASIDNSTWPVEISACKNGKCNTYIKPFKFRSLFGYLGEIPIKPSEQKTAWTYMGLEQMACAIKDGIFDSKHCFFLEEDLKVEKKKCATANSMIQSTFASPSDSAKAEFDEENFMCVLKRSQHYANAVKALEIGLQIGGLTLGTFMIVASAGTASVIGIAFVGAGLLADGVSLGMQIKMNKSSVKFLKLSTRCFDATCAQKYFEEEFKHMMRLMDTVNEDEFRVIDNEMNRLVGLLDEKYIEKLDEYKSETSGFFANMSTEEAIDTIATFVSLGLDAATAFSKVQKLMKASTKIKEIKFVKTLQNRASKLTKSTNKGTKVIAKAPVTQEATKAVGKTTEATTKGRTPGELRDAVDPLFDSYVAEVKSKPGKAAMFPKEKLTDAEWKTLNESLAKDNVRLVQKGDMMSLERVDDAANSGKKVITQKEIDNILVSNDKIARENQAYVEQVKKSGPEGKKWVALWEEHAPKNQSLKDFQAEFGNDITKAEKTFAGLSEAEIAADYDKVIKKYHDKYDADSYIKFREYVQQHDSFPTTKTKGFESWPEDQLASAKELYDSENMMKFKQEGALYATFDPEVSKIQKKYKTKMDALEKELNEELVPGYVKEHGNYDGLQESSDVKAWRTKRDALAEDYQYEIGQIALKNKNVVAEQMVRNYDNLLMSVPALSSRMSSWRSLSQGDKMTLLQDVMDAYATKYGTPKIKIVFEDVPMRADGFTEYGHYTTGTGKITMNTNPGTGGVLNRGEDDVMSAVLHEYGHAIDDIAPEKGSVGSQIKNLDLYTSKGGTYVLSPTEQSSYTISGTVQSGGNWALDGALARTAGKVDDATDASRVVKNTPDNRGVSGSNNMAGTLNPNAHVNNMLGDFLSRSRTLQELNGQGRLEVVTSSSLNGKQYMRINMGTNPDISEAQTLMRKLQEEGFYVSSNATSSGKSFMGVSRENIFEPWKSSGNNWLHKSLVSGDARNVSRVADKANAHVNNMLDDFLSRSRTLQELNGQGRLEVVTSSSLNGKQYMRINMGTNPDISEAQTLMRKLQEEGFYVSSNATSSGKSFMGVSRENIFEPWKSNGNNWLHKSMLGKKPIIAEPLEDVLVGEPIDDVLVGEPIDDLKAVDKANAYADNVVDGERAFNQKFPDFKKFGDEGLHVSTKVFGEEAADNEVFALFQDGYIAKSVPTKGVGGLEERYVVVAIKEDTAKKMGWIWNGRDFVRKIDNTSFLNNLRNWKGREITRIGNTPVILESSGSISARGIVTVRVGEKRIPFYVSSGNAGKTSVQTGKWEVFWGVGTGKTGWFNKGTFSEIENHYGSSELKQIAEALDAKLGDPRNVENILATTGRKSAGGYGIVADVDNLGNIETSTINAGFRFTPADDARAPDAGRIRKANMSDVVEYLRRL